MVGCLLVAAALAVIWGARLTVTRDLYVSELGAEGEPTGREPGHDTASPFDPSTSHHQ